MAENRGLLLPDNFTLSFDISKEQSLPAEEYSALKGGAVSVKADFSPSAMRRKYVDGERSVPLSDSRRFTVKLLPSAEDRVSKFLLEAARRNLPVKYFYSEKDSGFSESGVLLPTEVICENTAEGVVFTATLRNC